MDADRNGRVSTQAKHYQQEESMGRKVAEENKFM